MTTPQPFPGTLAAVLPVLSRTILVASGKGGVYKTTIVANAAALAAAAGQRVCIVDMDPQGDVQDDLGCHDDERLDDGYHLATSILAGTALTPVLREVRPNLDVIPGGEYLLDVRKHLARQEEPDYTLLARALAPLAENYDLIFIDSPPNDEDLQILSMVAARWVLVSTNPDPSSIRAIKRVRQTQLEAQTLNPLVQFAGVVLCNVPTSATQIRARAASGIKAILDGTAPLFDRTIRAATGSAVAAREKGIVAHELAEEVEGAQGYWEALRDGNEPPRLPGSAPALADDVVMVTDQLLKRINAAEEEASKEKSA